jgi:Gpi18-like mannosyltransferase
MAARLRILLCLAAAFALFVWLWPVLTFDMRTFLIPWMDHIRAEGPIGAFAAPFSNYAPPYLYLLALGSPLAPSLASYGVVKLVSLLGTLWLAYAAWRLLTAAKAPVPAGAAAGLLLIPTILLNAALLGQCDALWAAPCLLAVAAAIERKHAAMLVWCGLAFAFKAQAIFIAPFILAMLLAERTPWRYWLIPPAVYAALMVPAWAAGWPATDLALVYVRQAGYFEALAMNAPNLWQLVQLAPGTADLPLTTAAFAAAALAAGFLVLRFRRRLEPSELLALALLSDLILPGLLPRMHERFFFLADVMAFMLWARCRDRQSLMIFIAVELGSFLALFSCLSSDPIFAATGALAMIAATLTVAGRLLQPQVAPREAPAQPEPV